MNFRAMIINNVLSMVVSSALSIVLALAGFGPWSLVIGGLCGAILGAIALNLQARQRYRIGWDTIVAKQLGGYGVKIAANNLIEHFRNQSLILILSKMNGPSDVGIFNRASSLSTLPMRVVGTAPYQAVFRALAATQDDLDGSRYIYFRTITLVTVYTFPLYVLTWWLAEPGIRFLYGNSWVAAAEPLTILAASGFFACVANPSGAVIEARNRLTTELWLNGLAWAFLVAGALWGLRWGIAGLSWAVVFTRAFYYSSVTAVAIRELDARFSSLISAIKPALILNVILITVIAVLDTLLLRRYAHSSPGSYIFGVTLVGGLVYAGTLLFLPLRDLKSEAAKWRNRLMMRR